MLDRNDLLIVEAIARHGTVTKAADELCITQSAMSHGMKRIEARHEVAIWERQGRGVSLTDAGEDLLRFAKRVLPQFEQMESLLDAHAKGEMGRLQIGMECYPCFQWLLKIVAPFLKAYPNVDVDVLKEFQFGGLAALFNCEVDVLITPDPLFKDGLDYEPVFEYQQVLVMPDNHHLATKPWVEPKDLCDQVLLTYPVEKSRLDVFNYFLTPANQGVGGHKTIETTEIMLQMVAAGRGVAVLPDWLVEEHSTEFGITAKPLGPNGIEKQIFIARRTRDLANKQIDAFVSMAKSHTRYTELD